MFPKGSYKKEMTKENIDRLNYEERDIFYWMKNKHFIRMKKARCAK